LPSAIPEVEALHQKACASLRVVIGPFYFRSLLSKLKAPETKMPGTSCQAF
jgi:hypothetical protein